MTTIEQHRAFLKSLLDDLEAKRIYPEDLGRHNLRKLVELAEKCHRPSNVCPHCHRPFD